MRGTVFEASLLQRIGRGDVKMENVILPNETWLINSYNLILNGDAETNVSTLESTVFFLALN